MIDYPIDIKEPGTNDYDPFLHHVIRHKLRKKKSRRRLGRLLRKHPKARLLRSIGIGRRRRKTRPVRRPIRTLGKRHRRPTSHLIRNRAVSRSRTIKKPLRRSPVKFGNPVHRDLQRNSGISKIGIMNRPIKRAPIMSGDPSYRRKPQVFVPLKKNKPAISRDTVIPYKRSYGSSKRKVMPKRMPKETMPQLEEELPIEEQDMIASDMEVIDSNEKDQKPQDQKDKRKMKNIIGVTALSILVVGVIAYKMKSRITLHGRTSGNS